MGLEGAVVSVDKLISCTGRSGIRRTAIELSPCNFGCIRALLSCVTLSFVSETGSCRDMSYVKDEKMARSVNS